MALQKVEELLGFRVKVYSAEVGSVIWLQPNEDGTVTERACRPATLAEIKLWKALVDWDFTQNGS